MQNFYTKQNCPNHFQAFEKGSIDIKPLFPGKATKKNVKTAFEMFITPMFRDLLKEVRTKGAKKAIPELEFATQDVVEQEIKLLQTFITEDIEKCFPIGI